MQNPSPPSSYHINMSAGPFMKMQLHPYKDDTPLSSPNSSLHAIPIRPTKKRKILKKRQ